LVSGERSAAIFNEANDVQGNIRKVTARTGEEYYIISGNRKIAALLTHVKEAKMLL